jgi:L-ascorbate metabolism protein UlaG (beta-lactamase superfamily)
MTLNMTLIGGPTVLIDAGGFRIVTDPTFDAPGEYRLSYVTLTKTSGPALAAETIGEIDAVLLSHDQHSDNLDGAGHAFLAKADRVLTTAAGAARLDGNAEGLMSWQTTQLTAGAHLTQSGDDIERAFTALGLRSRLQMLKPGVATAIDFCDLTSRSLFQACVGLLLSVASLRYSSGDAPCITTIWSPTLPPA